MTEVRKVYLHQDIDSQNAYENRNKYEIYRWCRQFSPITREHHYNYFMNLNKDNSVKMFAIGAAGANQVGVCGLTSIDRHNRSAEFSIWVDPGYKSSGYGKQALSLLLTYGFDILGLNRIWGEVFEGNPALESFLSIGFKEVGRLRQSYYREGRFIDSIMIDYLFSEFKESGQKWSSTEIFSSL